MPQPKDEDANYGIHIHVLGVFYVALLKVVLSYVQFPFHLSKVEPSHVTALAYAKEPLGLIEKEASSSREYDLSRRRNLGRLTVRKCPKHSFGATFVHGGHDVNMLYM
jgi:hypothetical protein